MKSRIPIAIVVVMVLFGWIGGQRAARATVPAGFVTRSGTQLMLRGQPFRFTGVNIYNANSDGWCGFQYSVAGFDQTLSDLGPGKEVIRAWFFQSLATENGQRDWSRFDRTIAAAGAHGMKVIVTLTDQWGECGDGVSGTPTGYKDATWYQTGYRTITQPDALVPYRDWVAEVVNRYKDDPRVAFWQLINEAEVNDVVNGQVQPCPAGNGPADTLRAWAQDVGGVVKSIDQNHLVSLGTIGGGQCGAQSDQYQDVHDIPEIDLCEYHDYGAPTVGVPGDQWNGLQRRIDQCNAINKPLFVGEAGIKPSELDGTYTARADAFQAKVNAQTAAGVRGFLAWAWSAQGSTPDNYDIGPGDPALGALIGPGHTDRISVANGGGQLNTWSESSRSEGISADGRYVVFETQAALTPADTNSYSDIYVRDRQTNSLELISTRANGSSAFAPSYDPVISSDGSTVAFMSMAPLDPNDSNGDFDIYARRRGDPASVERVSVSMTGGNANYTATNAAISAAGRFVTFLSRASNIVPGDPNGRPDVFVRDTQLDSTDRVSVGPNGEDPDVEGTQGSSPVSADGRFVVFNTSAPLDPTDGNGKIDVYLRDRQAPTTIRVSEVLGGGDAAEGGSDPSMTADGTVIAFTGCSDDLVSGDTNGTCDVFERVSLGPTRLVTYSTSGTGTNGASFRPAIAADGSYLAFESYASDLVAGDTNGQADVFAQDRAGLTVLASVSSDGVQGNSTSFEASVSSGGAVVAFGSYASNLVPGDTNGERDVFVRVFGGTPATVPDAPAAPTATSSDGSADVSWSAPANDGGSAITGYTVRSSGGQSVTVGPSTYTAHVGGLTNGVTYTFTVVATNSVGDSQPSQPSNAVTPNAKPGDPTSLGQFEANGTTAIPLGGTTDGTTVVLKGTVSDPDGGQVRLEVEVKSVGTAFDGAGVLQSQAVVSGTVAQVTLTGLTRSRAFHWRARTVDSVDATSDWVSFGVNAESNTDFRVEGRIVFSSNRQGANNANAQEIYVMDPDGSNATRLTTNTTIDTDPALSPDGTKIAFQSNRDGDNEIYVMNIDGSGVVQLTTNTAADQSPAWSPDGTKIAFVSNRVSNGNYDIFSMDSVGTNVTRLTTNVGTDTYPSWSPDGTKIAFMSPRDGDEEIFTMNTNGTGQVQLTVNKRNDTFPAWSPDGTKIVFSSNRDASNNPEIYVMNANGTSAVRLTTKAGDDTAPAWSREGARIVFQGIDTDNDWEIYRILANGTGSTKLTNNMRADVTPSW